MSLGAKVVALCDVDERRLNFIKREAGLAHAATYTDYRHLFEKERSLDGVVIATPDHWHMLLCRAAMRAGKHIYCEKPLARTVGEARAVRDLAHVSHVITQMGNQGSASASFRRAVEVIEAGALGQIRDIYTYIPGGRFPRGINRPPGAGGTPRGLNWDIWLGPAPAQPYHEHIYHPFDWRGWYEFGSGQLGDFGCHALNLPMRALKLGYPHRVEVSGTGFGKESYFTSGQVRYHFAARPGLAPVTLTWYDEVYPPTEVFRDVIGFYNEMASGVLLVGDNGILFTSPHNTDCILMLKGDRTFQPLLQHDGVRDVPIRLPRIQSHHGEWVNACKHRTGTYSNFTIGGLLTEIVQAGVVALRLGHSIDWDGERMCVPGIPRARHIVHPDYRTRWA